MIGVADNNSSNLTREQVAAVMRAKWDLGIAGGVVVAQPIPVEDEIPASEIDGIIAQAESILRELPMTIHGKEPQWASAR